MQVKMQPYLKMQSTNLSFMKKIALTAVIAVLSLGATKSFAQIEEINEFVTKKHSKSKNLDTVAWIYNGEYHLGINQGILHNWQSGGELASANVNSFFKGSLIRYYHRHSWVTNLDAAYGLFYAYSNHFIPRKTDDRIDLTSKYGYSLKKDSDLFLTILGNANTQFTNAYDYNLENWREESISRFLSPLYVTLAPGLEYRRGENLNLFFSPIAARMTFASTDYTTRNEEGAFGIPYGKKSRFELGAYFTGRYKVNLAENITYRTRLDLYSNYLAKDVYKDNVLVKKDNPSNIDILWENDISFKFFKYFSLNVGVLAIYDNDIPFRRTTKNDLGEIIEKDEPFQGLGWWQIKQTMSIGFNYTF